MARTTNKELQAKYLEAYFESGCVQRRACKKVGVSERTASTWHKSEEFLEKKEAWIQFLEESILEALLQRAVEKDNTAAIFLLKSIKPELYDDQIRKLKYMADNDIQESKPEVNFVITDARELLNPSNGMGSQDHQ